MPPTAPCSITQVTAPCRPSSSRTRGTLALMPEADVHRPALPQLLRDAAGDDLGRVEFGRPEGVERTEQLARDRGVIGGGRGLQLVRGLDDDVDQDPGHAHVMGFERAALRDALDLRDDEAARGAGRKRHLHRAQRRALLLEAEVAVLVGRGGADDGHIGLDRGEMQPSPLLRIPHASQGVVRVRSRSSRSRPARDRRRYPCPPWSAPRAAWPPPRAACRRRCPRARSRRHLFGMIICQIRGGSALVGPEG